MTPTIHVIATTFDGTKAALRAAMPRAIRQDARVVLLVPHTASDGPDRSQLSARAVLTRYDDLAKTLDHPVQIRLCLTPSAGYAVTQLIPTVATVFLGGEVRVWWPSAEERLAARLRRSGRDVVFIGCNSGRPPVRSREQAHA